MKKPLVAARRNDPAVVFRREIEAALEAGAKPKNLILKLTLKDASHMKRDPNIAVSDIGFKDGEMRFLGVIVEQGGVSVSTLENNAKPPKAPKAAPADVVAKESAEAS